jgi:hypothetical protein
VTVNFVGQLSLNFGYARATSHKLKPSGASRQKVTVYQSLHFLSNH